MSAKHRLELGLRELVCWALSAVLFGPAAGCITPSEWKERWNGRPTAEESEPSQLAATEGHDAFADGGFGGDESEAISPRTLEDRVQEYVEHFLESRAEPEYTPKQEPVGGPVATNRQVDASPPPRNRRPEQEWAATTPEHSVSSEPGDLSAPRDEARRKDAESGDAPALPEREQVLPVVLSVSAEPDLLWDEGGEEAQAPTAPSEPNRGAEVAVVASPNDIGAIIERLEEKVARDPNDLEAQVRLRLLYIVGGEDQKASTAPEGLADETAELLQSLAQTIIEARNAAVDLGLGADRALRATRTLASHLSRYAQLSIPRVVLARRVDSYGVYNPIDPPSFAAGSPISAVVYTELENFHSQPGEQGNFETVLSQRLELLDANGQRIWQREDADIVDVSKNQRMDFFLAPVIRLPADLEPGTYHLRVEVQDHLSGKFTSASVPLTVLGTGSDQRLSSWPPPGPLVTRSGG